LKDLSIIITNFRSLWSLGHCLESLSLISETALSFEVIVVNNGYRDNKFDEFRKIYPHFIFVSNRGPWDFSSRYDLGAASAIGKYLLFFNSDEVLSEKSLLGMLDQAKASKANSIISYRQTVENDPRDRPFQVFPSMMAISGWQGTLYRILNFGQSQKNSIAFRDWGSWSVILLRKTSFTHVRSVQSHENTERTDYSYLQNRGLKEAYGSYFWF
jgi:glycosyltransferase involved in cell wall biosynthesis